MKKLLYILLFAPLALFGQEEDPCYSVIDFILQTEVENPSLEVNLVAGWNMIGYPCSQDMLLTYGFSSIENDIAIVKDNNGNVYLPEFSFNGIGFLEGGQGYQVKMNEFVMGFTFCQSIQFPTIEGCTNCEAVNFNQWANVDDGSCIAVFLGCTDEIALNYNSEANTDNSSCLYYECTDSLACNYDEISNQEDGSCEYPLEEDLDCDGNPLINCYYPPDPEFVSLLQGNTEGVMNGDCLDIDADFVYVQSLGINDSNISNLDGIQYFTNLSYLYIEHNDGLTSIPDLSGLTNLSSLYILNNAALTSLPELSGLTNLSEVFIYGNDGLTSLLQLSGLTNLSTLEIFGNNALTNLPELSGLTNLDTLGIHNNDWLECVGDYPEQLTIQESWPPVCETTYQVGDLAEGGIVFYIDETGEHGLIASVGEISEGAYSGPAVTYGYEWGCYATEVNGADDNFLGSGLQNSLDITYQNCTPNSNSEYITAADAAISYVYEGFDDWYLPSIDELNLLNSVFELNGKHWSSTEMNLHNAHTVGWSAQAFQAGDAKIYANKVRPIRSF